MLWVALAIFVVATGASAAFVAVRALEAWRGLRAAGSEVSDALARVTAAAEAAGRRADELGGSSAPVAEAADRLAASRAQLLVLTSALDDVRRRVEPFRLRK